MRLPILISFASVRNSVFMFAHWSHHAEISSFSFFNHLHMIVLFFACTFHPCLATVSFFGSYGMRSNFYLSFTNHFRFRSSCLGSFLYCAFYQCQDMLFGFKLSHLYVECATLLFSNRQSFFLRATLTTIFIVFLSTLCSVFYGNIMSSNFLDVIGQNSFPRHFPCTSPAPGLTLRAPFSNILYLLLSCCRSSHTTTCTFLFFSTLRVTLLLSSPLYHRHHVHVTDWTDRSSQHTNSNIALSSPAVNFFIAAPPQFTLIHGLRPVTTAFHTTVHVHHDMLHFHASTFLFSSAFSFGNHHSVALVVRNLFLFFEH